MLDEKDKIIIAYLMADCRISTTKLAKITKLSQPSIVYRIKNLEKKGYIDRYDALLDYNKFAPLQLDNFMITVPKEKTKLFEEYCKNNKSVMSVFKCTHKHNYSITTFGRQKDSNIIINYLNKENFEYIYSNNMKSYFPTFSIFDIPIKQTMPKYTNEILKLDKNDVKILEALSHGSAKDSILELSKKTGISHDIVLYRYKKLKKAGYLPLFLAQVNLEKFHLNYCIVLFKTKNIAPEDCFKRIHNINKTVWFGEIDENNYMMTIVFRDYNEYNKILGRIYEDFDGNMENLELFPINGWLFLNRINLNQLFSKK